MRTQRDEWYDLDNEEQWEAFRDLEASYNSMSERLHCMTRERDELARWKKEAMAVESEWDEQALAELVGAPLGSSCRKAIAAAIPRLIAERDEASRKLQLCRERLWTLVYRCDNTMMAHTLVATPHKELTAAKDFLAETEPKP